MIKELTPVLNFLRAGEIEATPFAVIEGSGRCECDYDVTQREEAHTLRAHGICDGLFEDSLYFEYNERELTCKRVFKALAPLKLRELGFDARGIDLGTDPKDDYFYHVEMPRIYDVMTIPIDARRGTDAVRDSGFDVMAGNRWADPGTVTERVGASPYQPFPAILLSNYKTRLGVVHGTLSQDVFFHNYLIGHEGKTIKLEIFSSVKAVGYRELAAGEILVDEWYLGRCDEADDIEKIFESYSRVLRKKLPASYGRSDINRTCLVWGSWNDGIFRDVSEELIVKEARFLSEHFPTVRWIQIDDGYATINKVAHGLGVPYEGEAGVDKAKFPNGMRGVSDKIREYGLRPAIWVGGFCPKNTPIFNEHPEWFIDYDYRVTFSAPLDVTIPEAREYMRSAITEMCRDWGFDAVKHDFWSYAFEDSRELCKNHEKSGYENRRAWLRTIRDALPRDGYMQTGCDIVMGNPFLGEFFTNYRYGIDIGEGVWDNVRTSFQWGAACFSTHTGDLFPPNSDSIGIFPCLSEDEATFCINYCLVTHSMVEIAGKLSEVKDEKRLAMLRKAACNPNNGQDVYFVGFDYRKAGRQVPEVMYFKTPHFSRNTNKPGAVCMPLRTVGIFNLEDEEREFTVRFEDLKLGPREYLITNVWGGEVNKCTESFTVKLRPHASKLLAISTACGLQLLDANIRINAARLVDDNMILDTDYAANDVELKFNEEPTSVELNGEALDFKKDGTTLRFDAKANGRLIIRFSK